MNELLRKANDPLDSLIGQSFNQKSKLEAKKILDEIHSKAESRTIGKSVLCYVTDNSEIKGVGGSTLIKNKNGKIFSNLILDNFGLMMAKMFSANPAVTRIADIIDDVGTAVNIRQYAATNFNGIGGLGVVHQIGSGTTVPVRPDINIETAFGTAPESGDLTSNNPTYNSGLGNFKSTSVTVAGGGGTINETVLKNKWSSSGGVLSFTIFRDIISPSQAFLATQSITLEYTIQL